MRNIALIILINLLSSMLANGQDVYPYTVPGPEGIYIMCGSEIPENFSYRVFRSEAGKEKWEELATLAFYRHFDNFFSELTKASGHNPLYELPSEKQKGNIWKWIQNTNHIDSIPYYGGIPMYWEALGLAWYDREAQKNTSYDYKVVTVKNSDGAEHFTRGVSYPSAPVNYQITSTNAQAMEKYVNLEYEVAEKKHIHTVKLFRSYYLQSDFAPVNANLGFNNTGNQLKITALDTTVMRKGIVLYYLQPYDLYGNPGIPSDTVRITNLVNKEETWFEGIQASNAENGIRLTWKFEVPEYLRSIDIYKSEEYDNSYIYLLSKSPTDTVFVDENVKPNQNYFYYFVLNNAYGKSERSARVIGLHTGNESVLAPVNLMAKAASGKVILNWTNPNDNINAWHIFRADGKSLEFIQLGTVEGNDLVNVMYIDSLPAELNSGSLAYFVKAENTSFKLSPPSNTIFVNAVKPNSVLTAPLNLESRYLDNKILLSWDLVGELDLNVLEYSIERRHAASSGRNSDDYKILYTTSQNYFEDTNIQVGEVYEYRVSSVGLNELKSTPSVSSLCRVPVFRPAPVASLQVFKTESGYQLNWNKTTQENIKNYKIYRIQNNLAPLLLATLTIESTTYEDQVKDLETVFLYAVSCVNEKGIESKTEEWTGAD